ncbi:adenosine/AMP deaminase domain protein [Metarhizium robertsii]|uniref:adenosine deaminase n=2 Tax=Metarhizium robertsii TaxID=568076 RepID=E9ESG0_METRA|nr:adenosine deaminase-related growth factor [Metarhizium robertsii ARSEF 23]EFZ01677.1 adenosine deaminase-related growth factor [Metarhizium robertsii ARSEF 23]EXU96094.1 adenosine/AMP deaminase domain protein [Metarhizium robertsii]
MAMPNDVWDEISQDIPSASDPFIQQYMAGRENLINQEKTSRSDTSFRKSLSPIAKRACTIVDRIRSHEHKTVWTPDVEEHMAQTSHECIFPGMMFMFAKDRMESTNLWKIVRKMPKGCLLHSHMDAMVNFDYLLDVLLSTPGIHMSSDRPLRGKDALENAAMNFRYKSSERTDGSLWEESYKPQTFILLTKAADEFPDGGRQGFLRWLKSRCTLSTTDSHEHHHGIDAIWRKFAKCFIVVATIIHYEPIFRAFLRRLMSQLKSDGVNWVELRFTWPLDYCRDRQEEPEQDYSHMFKVIEEEVARFKASPEGKGFWGLTTIWTTLRSIDTRPLIENMDHCITTKMEFPHLVAGYDLVGPEDLGKPLVDVLPELFWFRKQCAQEGINIPFFFHAGETLGDGNSTDSNLFDAILLGTRRIGHAYSLYKHPLLIDMVKDKRILVESCPISNEVLRLCGSVLAHPLPALLARGVACCLCNDDPAMLGQDTAGMSHDFWQALQGWDNLGLAGLGSLAENSVRWAAFEDQEAAAWANDIRQASLGSGIKAERLKQWQVEWEQFCLWIVTEFGDEFDPEGETTGAAEAEAQAS